MLEKSQRFHGHNSLRPVYNKGKSTYTRSMKVLWTPSTRETSRAAIVVSKKVHKSAVVRNRIRRRLYAQLKTLFKEAAHPADVIVVVNDASLALMPKRQLQQEVASLAKAALGVNYQDGDK